MLELRKFTFRTFFDSILGEKIFLCKWKSFLSIVAEKLNATVKYNFVERESLETSDMPYLIAQNRSLNGTLDFYLEFDPLFGALYSYNQVDWCYQVANPPSYSVTELILFLPLDQ